jgi:very-short-patch-repair endonuclease
MHFSGAGIPGEGKTEETGTLDPSPRWGEGRVRGMKRPDIDKSRLLRKNQTDAERKLWSLLRNRHVSDAKFRRQFPVSGYILDFYSPKYKLCIEADGGQHYNESGRASDEIRTQVLSKVGIKVIRFSDRDILNNIEGVGEVIYRTLLDIKTPSPQSSPQRGEEVKSVMNETYAG